MTQFFFCSGRKILSQLTFWHHVLLIIFIIPTLLFIRSDGLGDTFISYAFLLEASNPFVAISYILRLFNSSSDVLKLVNSVFLTTIYFTVRLLGVTVLIVIFANQKKTSFFLTLWSIPIKCQVSTAVMMSMQVYWFFQLVRNVVRYTSRVFKHPVKAE